MILIILVISISILSAFLYFFDIVQIVGNSMHPTLKDKEIILASRVYKSSQLNQNSIYLFKAPTGKITVKRLTYIQGEYCYFVGDNSNDSYDSRDYGFIHRRYICSEIKKKR